MLSKQWTDYVINFVKQNGEEAFWKDYGVIEKEMYTKTLSHPYDVIKGKVSDLAKEYNVTDILFMGFMDGINDSLVNKLDIDKIESDTEVELKIDLEKLYYNMLDSKADYLYNLPQWDAIFSQEKRKEIHKAWVSSKTVVNKKKIGRNDPCPCGSGKKYKNCCGKNK